KLNVAEFDLLLEAIPSDGEYDNLFYHPLRIWKISYLKVKIAIPLIDLVPDSNDKILWRKTGFPVAVTRVFAELCGPNISEDCETPFDVFLSVFPTQLVKHLVFKTNLYATQKGKPFVPTVVKEMKKFLEMNLLMGIKSLPSFKDDD
ncbi:hypothetical protein ILUMI_18227, partial [Ignelater luminosus]